MHRHSQMWLWSCDGAKSDWSMPRVGLNEEIKFCKSITCCRLIYWFGFGFHIFEIDSATTPEVEWLFDMKGSWGWAPGPGAVKGPTETRGQERAQQGHLHLPNTELWPPGRVSTNEVFSDIAPKQRQTQIRRDLQTQPSKLTIICICKLSLWLFYRIKSL